MYQRYFGMKHRPFTATPQTSLSYPAACQEEAFATLHYAITQGRGIAVLTGLPGTGKSLVCHRLTTELESAFTTAMITNTHMPTVKGLLQAILYDLSLPFHGLDEQELRLTLTDFLLGKYAGGGRMVLVIDEAQNLGIPLLEELRMFCNLEGESDKLFQIVLAGHPRLLQLLRNPELETLTQRIGARATLTALSDEETIAYIQHLVECAGARCDQLFTYDALCAVYEATEGNPRRINQLCDHALLRAYVSEVRRIDAAIIAQAMSDLQQPAELRTTAALKQGTESATELEMTPDHTAVAGPGTNPNPQQNTDTFVACTECEGALETVAINTNQLIEDADPLLAFNIEPATMAPRSDFIDEEVIIDPYAMMDAARSALPNRTLMAVRPAPAAAPRAAAGDESANADAGQIQLSESFLSNVRFVESGDNPAVHEVGAGTMNLTGDDTESPILVIENRQQRIGNHIARVDAAQQPGRENRGYRRLFTHARKS